MLRLKNLFKNNSILILFIVIDVLFFWKFFFQGLIPIPADLIIGGYYPWLNEKWGYIVGVPVKNALMSDVVSLLYPWRFQAIELMKSGQLPLWDATTFLGMSLIGNFQAGVLNPFNLLFWLPFSFNRIWGLQVVLQPLLAMFSMYLMLRNWQLTKKASVFGAVSFAFSAQILVWIQYNHISFINSVFPLLIYFIDKFKTNNKIVWLSCVAFLTAYLIFAGYPQMLYYFTLFGTIYIFYTNAINREWKNQLKDIFLFGVFMFLGLCLSGASLLPGLESLSLSIKSLDVVAASNSVLFLPWQNLLTGLIPDFFGNPATNNYFGIGYYESFIFYTSIVCIPFALIALNSKPRSNKALVCILFILIAFILALKNPLSNLTQTLDFLGLKGSVSSRVLFIYGFSLSGLSAIGLDKFLKSDNHDKYSLLKYLPLFAVAAMLMGVLISLGFIKVSIGNFDLITSDYSKVMTSFKNSAIPLSLISVASFLILISSHFNKKIVYIGLMGLLLFDYYRFSSKYLPYIESGKIFPETASISYLKNAGQPFRIGIERGELLPANTWSVYNIESGSGYNILLPKETANYLNYLNQKEFSDSYARFTEIKNTDSSLADIANIKYYLVLLRKEGLPDKGGGDPFYLDQQKYEKAYQEGPVVIYRNKKALERFYSPEKAVLVKTPLQAYQTIVSKEFKSTETVTVESEISSNFSTCQITNLIYTTQKTSLDTQCSSEGFLAFSQIYYPGWKAAINGTSAKIIKTNGIFSGLQLPPGNSEITISYRPDSFFNGIVLSLISLITLVILNTVALLQNFKRRRIVLRTPAK